MNQDINNNGDNEIDVGEIFLTLWAYKFIIILTTTLSLAFGLQYFLNTEKKFTSSAVFRLSGSSPDNSMSSNGLASLVGISVLGSQAKILNKEEITGRIFIEELNIKLNLIDDEYFNSYNINSTEPAWKKNIKSVIGWSDTKYDPNEVI